GALLNLHADELAVAVAAALGASTLLLLSDTPGLQLDGAPVERLGARGLERAIVHPDVRDGMIVKLRAARAALLGGVARVRIACWSGPGSLHTLLGDTGPGTTIQEGEPR